MTLRISFTGYCPELDDENTIQVSFTAYNVLRDKTRYKKGSLHCEYCADNGCNIELQRKCPIYNSATYDG